ncbi:CapA family protein, partial [Nitrosomonas sp. JL21]|uniref:CapA family protein n=1 Tax=Nitrosomonas sp. JL21 TaxID=153949 RepID=UPI00136F200A|nr:CapA family protein [Nitrosomonas sp. JL21]
MSCRTKFVAVGDISLGDSPLTLGFGVRGAFEKKRFGLFNDDIRRVFKSADLCFGNLETVVSDKNYNYSDLVSAQMRGGSNMAKLLADSGISVLSVANNHMMQHGPIAFEETVSLLNFLNISPVGVADEDGRVIAYMREVNGKVFCFLGYSMRAEKYNKPVLYSKGSREMILTDIEQYKDSCDYLILSLHWGDEFVDFPSPVQVSIAHEFINAGAKIIIGHHPHVVQGVEKYNGGVIAYSLGNFVFDFWQKRLRESMILVV